MLMSILLFLIQTHPCDNKKNTFSHQNRKNAFSRQNAFSHQYHKNTFFVKTEKNIFPQNRKNIFSSQNRKNPFSCQNCKIHFPNQTKIYFFIKISNQNSRQNYEYIFSAKTSTLYFLPKPYFKILIF